MVVAGGDAGGAGDRRLKEDKCNEDLVEGS